MQSSEKNTLEKKQNALWKRVCREEFALPPKFEDSGWRLIHSEDGRKCQLDRENGWDIWRGNGPDEISDMVDGAVQMHGDCLILGLGIGLVVQYIDFLQECSSITIVENSPVIIKHIEPWLKSVTSTPLEIICQDDEEFLKVTDRKWDTMFANTWIKCTDALEKISMLKKLSRKHVLGTRIYWAEKELRSILRKEKNTYSYIYSRGRK